MIGAIMILISMMLLGILTTIMAYKQKEPGYYIISFICAVLFVVVLIATIDNF